jgi:hypothetical protein
MEDYKESMVNKFGVSAPRLDRICKVCGKRFGEHCGSDCPASTHDFRWIILSFGLGVLTGAVVIVMVCAFLGLFG